MLEKQHTFLTYLSPSNYVLYMLTYVSLVPEFAGSNPTEAVGFLTSVKNPQHAFLQRGSKRICPMSQLCGM
jgi:hypothetical protein